jgi:hypothetical protein
MIHNSIGFNRDKSKQRWHPEQKQTQKWRSKHKQKCLGIIYFRDQYKWANIENIREKDCRPKANSWTRVLGNAISTFHFPCLSELSQNLQCLKSITTVHGIWRNRQFSLIIINFLFQSFWLKLFDEVEQDQIQLLWLTSEWHSSVFHDLRRHFARHFFQTRSQVFV